MMRLARRRGTLAALVSVAAGCTAAGEPAHGSPTSQAPPTAQAAAPGTPPAAPAAPIDARAADAPGTAAVDAGAAGGAASPATSYAAALRAADWAHWPGLPADLREPGLLRDLQLGRARPHRRDGRLGRHDAVLVEAPGLRYWLRGHDHVVLIEITGNLGTAAPASLRAQLGAADREGAGRFLQSGATTTEYVYAGRGLAITVAESYDQPPKFPPRLAAVQLFAPSDLRSFDLELGGRDRAGPSR
jgi:hypothetical protein